MGYGDERTFIARAKRTNDVVLTPNSGKELLSLLSRYSSQNDPITAMSVFSHAYSRGIIFTNNEGFYGSQDFIGEIASFLGIWDQRDIDDLISMINRGKIFFSKDSVVKLFGCNLATGDFAQRLANAINATVIAGKGAVSPEIIGGRETGWMWADKGFYKYSPNHVPVSIGKRIYGR